MIDRAHAERLDAADPLAGFRERFVIDDPDTLYLDGNSLGRLPLATRERLRATVDQWGSELVVRVARLDRAARARRRPPRRRASSAPGRGR